MSDTSSIELSARQKVRKRQLALGVFILLALVFLVASSSPPDAPLHEAVEMLGLALILVCIIGRTWCSLYIGGKKRREIVDVGPYSVVRNPLYVFSLIGAAGVGMSTGSVTIAAIVVAYTYFVFRGIVLAEEAFLLQTFGSDYAQYCDQVPRWLPRFTRWRDAFETQVYPKTVRVTFCEACLFLVAIPVSELIERLQLAGIVPVLFHLV